MTGGGTGTFTFEAASGVFTEVQPVSFAFGVAGCISVYLANLHVVNSCLFSFLYVLHLV